MAKKKNIGKSRGSLIGSSWNFLKMKKSRQNEEDCICRQWTETEMDDYIRTTGRGKTAHSIIVRSSIFDVNSQINSHLSRLASLVQILVLEDPILLKEIVTFNVILIRTQDSLSVCSDYRERYISVQVFCFLACVYSMLPCKSEMRPHFRAMMIHVMKSSVFLRSDLCKECVLALTLDTKSDRCSQTIRKRIKSLYRHMENANISECENFLLCEPYEFVHSMKGQILYTRAIVSYDMELIQRQVLNSARHSLCNTNAYSEALSEVHLNIDMLPILGIGTEEGAKLVHEYVIEKGI